MLSLALFFWQPVSFGRQRVPQERASRFIPEFGECRRPGQGEVTIYSTKTSKMIL
jgi:hypothetical protein